ncbi:Bug family tripartite tricarboxylate transporter substrate binding protein [Roseomonas populi]|uniref:Tripartite tricarboxylate transporter substrate binding protein n=1 Tax=Roseomonas populi TaxID=3121582 RepID=A0ABT1WYY0_9PROT|nr:tripartite tricarboxylate transporter substrate binding protein [Roseomonas pecuniae]MCR0981043.1 tripartite tricarboxylate transporter substrate binding protein [Roseomonas pecuniae]
MKLTRRRLATTALSLAALPGLASGARAQGAEAWPNRPVRVLIGFPPGGGVDIVGRIVLPRAASRLGQPFVIENRGGANGNLAMEVLFQEPADGNTLFFGNVGNLAVTNALYPHLRFDTVRDFAPVAQAVEVPLVVTVHSRLPVGTLREFIDYAKARPGALNAGSGGSGGPSHLALELFNRRAGTDIVHVPYRGSAPALQDLATGRTQMMIDSYNIMRPMVEAGQVKLLAITSDARRAILPDLPTTAEAGLPDFVVYGWQGLVTRAGTPPEIIEKLEKAMEAALQEPEVRQALAAQGADVRFRGAAEFAAFLRAERERWGGVIRDAGITLN